MHDLSEENLLHSSKELKEMLVEQHGMTFKFKKVDGRFIHTFCAGQLLSKIGLTPEQVIGRELKDFLPEDMAAQKEQFYHKAWMGEEGVHYEGQIKGVFYLVSLRPIRKANTITEVIASCVDITARKKAEAQLIQAKELLESLIGNSVDGICVTDLEGKVIRVNEAFEKMYGWSKLELIGHPVPVFPIPLQEVFAEVREQLRHGERVRNFETIRQRKDGEMVHVCLTFSPIKDSNGEVVAFTCISRDITERKKSEDFYQRVDKLNVVGQLAAGLAHEIRNPLTSLRGFLQLMQANPARKSDHSELMLSEIDRINNIVSEFLIIAKPHATSFQVNDVGQILRNVVTLLEPQAILNNIQLNLEQEGEIPALRCSEMEIKQVFINILKNAIEAMPEGGNIQIMASARPKEVLIRIIDQGIGIPDSLSSKLGEPFFTTKANGTGLGLMMCYKIIRDHQGSININSVVGKGTVCDITLPLQKSRL